ncbi:MAG: hypothetical protein LBE98_01565 [Puniceicoccales bacterium]|jgi:hypothetical protein|nr:hypothetical protein [Puniceicoccales bacterium]
MNNNINQPAIQAAVREEKSWLKYAFSVCIAPTLISFANKTYEFVSKRIKGKVATITKAAEKAAAETTAEAAGIGATLINSLKAYWVPATPTIQFLKDKVIDFSKSAWSLASAHPVITISLVLAIIVIPVIREYCAKNERFTFCTPLVMAWMMVTRPFRLVYRFAREIPGGAEVDRQKFIQTVKGCGPILRRELQAKQQTVITAIGRVGCNETRELLNNTFAKVHRHTDEILKKGSLGTYKIYWEYLQKILKDEANIAGVTAVRIAIDDWKRRLDLCILAK